MIKMTTVRIGNEEIPIIIVIIKIVVIEIMTMI